MNTEYKLSGKSGNIFIVGILLGPILVTLLSIIYAYIDERILEKAKAFLQWWE
jgi:hypothetical protein